MDLLTIATDSLWAGLFSGAFGIVFTAPRRNLPSALLCGFSGRFARGILMSWGMTQNWSTVIAAVVVVLVAVAFIKPHFASPVVLISGVLPLGAATSVFKAILELLRISTLEGEALNESSVALSASVGKVFTTTLAIAIGLAVGMVIVRLLRREEVAEGV